MARIAGVNLPRDKRLAVALTYIYGIGPSTAARVADDLGLSRDEKVRDLTETRSRSSAATSTRTSRSRATCAASARRP